MVPYGPRCHCQPGCRPRLAIVSLNVDDIVVPDCTRGRGCKHVRLKTESGARLPLVHDFHKDESKDTIRRELQHLRVPEASSVSSDARFQVSVVGLPVNRLSHAHRNNTAVQRSQLIPVAIHEYSMPGLVS